jgi:hypothetical protein
MADGRGGYRRPTQPAAASGPGALSRRTDGRQPVQDMPNAKYGENAAYREAQMAAPMNGDIGSSAPPGMAPAGPDLSGLVPMGAPTQRPGEPITAGMPGGAGPGPGTPTYPQPRLDAETAARLRSYMPVFVMLASQDDADSNTRQFVRQLRAELG